MSKAIKVEDQVYADLDKLRGERGTFSQAIGQLLKDRAAVFTHLIDLEDKLKFQEWKSDQLREIRAGQEGG